MKPIELTVSVRNNRMKTMRLSRGMSQKMLAKVSGVSHSWVQQLESLRPIRFSRIPRHRLKQEDALYDRKLKISQALESSVEEMFPDELDLVISNRVVKHLDVPTAMALNANAEMLKLQSGEERVFSENVIELPEALAKIIDTLDKREAQIVRERFGIGGGGMKTLDEVAKKYGITRERARQIEAKAIRKLRHPSRSRRFKHYV